MNGLSFRFVAAGAAVTEGKRLLYRLKPSREGAGPSWDGRGGPLAAHSMASPVTDRSWWAGRYALCVVTMEDNNDTLVIDNAICTVSRAKNIVETQMVGRDGTIKEYINDGDWQIGMTVGVQAVRDGAIADEYPSEGVEALCRFLDLKRAFSVHSEFLKMFGIARMVVKSYSLSQATESNFQAVSVQAVSDGEYDIYSK